MRQFLIFIALVLGIAGFILICVIFGPNMVLAVIFGSFMTFIAGVILWGIAEAIDEKLG